MNEARGFVAKAAAVGASLLADPGALAVYLTTLKRRPLDVALPWISRKAIRFLENYLHRDMTVFEYGSGGSTIFFAQRCDHVISIEDDHQWATLVRERINQLGLTNVELQFHETGSIYTSSSAEFRRSSYLHAIDGIKPDVVLIDGADEVCAYGRNAYEMRRLTCFRYVEPTIAAIGGLIMVDDAAFYPELRKNSARKVVSFHGIGPCRKGVTTTDAFMY
jgi:hypothetical protein